MSGAVSIPSIWIPGVSQGYAPGYAPVCRAAINDRPDLALEHDTWEAADGSNREKHYVVAAAVEFLDRPRD